MAMRSGSYLVLMLFLLLPACGPSFMDKYNQRPKRGRLRISGHRPRLP